MSNEAKSPTFDFRLSTFDFQLGVDYYPEHWPEERWKQDARLMREAGLQVVRLGEFAWARLEPEAGKRDFGWLDRAINILAEASLKVIIGTPSATPPAWMIEAHPDMLPVAADGRTYSFGGRRHYCPSSAYYREQASGMADRLARHYANHRAIVGWQIDNELGNHGTTRCYCPRCRDCFAGWLQKRYGTLAALNEAWGTVFWSQEYSAWSQIPVPLVAPTNHNPSLELDFYRFSSDNAIEFLAAQVGAIREVFPPEKAFITHNVFPQDDHVDFYRLSGQLDFISWDNYPHGSAGPAHVAFHHDWMWGMKRRSSWVMEQQLGPINWTKYNPPVPPGQAQLWSWHNRAKGLGGTVYFRWRECRFGQEQYHSAFLRHDARPNRAYSELSQTHQELAALPDDYGQRRPAQVALLYSFDDRWALQLEPHNAAFNYDELVRDFYTSLYNRNIPCDVLPRGTNLATLQQYKLVIAPAPHLMDEIEQQAWQDYVKLGGKLLMAMRAGVKSPSNVWTEQTLPGGLSDFLGARVDEELSFPPPGAGQNDPAANWGWREWTAEPLTIRTASGQSCTARRLWAEVLSASTEVETLAHFTQADPADYFVNAPALLGRQQGEGKIFYLACWPEESLYSCMWDELFQNEALPVDARLPQRSGLEIVASGERGQYITLLNHSKEPLDLDLPEGYTPLLPQTPTKVLPPYGVAAFRRD